MDRNEAFFSFRAADLIEITANHILPTMSQTIFPKLPAQSIPARLAALTMVLFSAGAAPAQDAPDAPAEPGFVALFNGADLTGWDGNPAFWSVRDGAITGQTTADNPTRGNTFLMWKGGTVADFDLRLKFRIVGGNSGIQYRSKDLGNWVASGYQADFEAGTTYSGILYEERGRGILAKRGERTIVHTAGDKHAVEVAGSLGESNEIQKVIRQEEWNDYRIIANGNQFTHIINGRVTVEVTDEDIARRSASGLLALQLHAGPPMLVQFKDIRVRHGNPVNVAGVWNCRVETPNGTGEPTLTLTQHGHALSGTYDGLLGKLPIAGRIDDHAVSFTLEGDYEGNTVKAAYHLIEKDGALSGKISINDGTAELDVTAARRLPE